MTDRTGQLWGNYHLLHPLSSLSIHQEQQSGTRGTSAYGLRTYTHGTRSAGGAYRSASCDGEVYLGEHLYLHTHAALKIFYASVTDVTQHLFLNEVQKLSRLQHPHIIRLLDFAVEDTNPFLIMEYLSKGNIYQACPPGSCWPLAAVVAAVSQVAAALQFAHECQIVHGDLKPENVLLNANQKLIVTDFSLNLPGCRSSLQEQTNPHVLRYKAPEQFTGDAVEASDQYALAIMAYEWLCGNVPFQGSASEIRFRHLQETVPALRERLPDLNSAVESVIFTALAKEPGERYASIGEFAQKLLDASSRGQTRIVDMHTSAASLDRRQRKIPVPLMPMIGREREVEELCTLLRQSETRLVTILGAGGVGKTRLALAVAKMLENEFPQGAWQIPLAHIRDVELVMPAIAHALDVCCSEDQPIFELVQSTLEQQQLLLLLDNFEQVIEAAPLLIRLLEQCPGLKMLVTSRAVLHVQGEQEYLLQPLTYPGPVQSEQDVQEPFIRYSAIEMFVQRAHVLQSDFRLTGENARTIAEICRLVDGLPLAIELAVSRLKLFTLEELPALLSHRLQVLTGGRRDLPDRQRTLRDTFRWSYELLSSEEQKLFRWLSVFCAGCTLQAAEQVCQHAGLTLPILDGISSLLDNSMLIWIYVKDARRRPLMLETLREYGLDCLREAGEEEQAREAHARYYVQLVEESEAYLCGSEQRVWLNAIERELGNVRQALEWLFMQQHKEEVWRLVGSLGRFWLLRGSLYVREYWREGLKQYEQMLSLGSEGVPEDVQARAYCVYGVITSFLGDIEQAEKLNLLAIRLYREIHDPAGLIHACLLQGQLYIIRNEYEDARRYTEEVLLLSRQIDDAFHCALGLRRLAIIDYYLGRYEHVLELIGTSAREAERAGDGFFLANVSRTFAEIQLGMGDIQATRTVCEYGIKQAEEVGMVMIVAWLRCLFGAAALYQHSIEEAVRALTEALTAFNTGDDKQGILYATLWLAQAEQAQRRTERVIVLCQSCLPLILNERDRRSQAFALECLGRIIAFQGVYRWAAQCWGTAEALREAIHAPQPPAEYKQCQPAIAMAREHLTGAFSVAWQEGRQMTASEAVTLHNIESLPRCTAQEAYPADDDDAMRRATLAGLTRRELEVLRLVAEGYTNAQIGEQLVISRVTVNSYLRSIYSKLGVSSRTAAMRYALDHDLL